MNLKNAIMSLRPFKRKKDESYSQYFEAGTGPEKEMTDSDYFIHDFIISKSDPKHSSGLFSTSIDLYADDVFAHDWEVYEEDF